MGKTLLITVAICLILLIFVISFIAIFLVVYPSIKNNEQNKVVKNPNIYELNSNVIKNSPNNNQPISNNVNQEESNKEIKLFMINDDCSVYFGRIIHTIKSEGDCKINCNNECDIRKMNFARLDFIEYLDKCNICNCYCK